MLNSQLAASLRNIERNKLYAGINIVGLAVGFAAAILIALYVRHEFTYDRFWPGYERIYRISTVMQMPGQGRIAFDTADCVIAGGLKLDFPSLEAVARIAAEALPVRRAGFEANETVQWADPGFFSLFPFPAIAGDPATALDAPDGVVLTRAMARKYFGRDAPIGETLELDRQHPMRVTAVLADPPSNTHLDLGIVASSRAAFSTLAQFDARPPRFHFDPIALTYFRLKAGVSIAEVESGLDAFVERRMGIPKNNRLGVAATLPIAPVADIHLIPAGMDAMTAPADARTLLAILTIGVLIVLAASINFVNLMTARASRRAIEVGVRKVAGARRRNLMVQFIGEALIYAGAGTVLAIVLAELLLPSFSALLDRGIAYDYWRDPVMLGGVGALLLVVGVLAGFYPAFVLSRFRPAAVLKGNVATGSGASAVRTILVVVQFAILIGLILATGIIYRQTIFAMRGNSKLASENVLLVESPCGGAFRQALGAVPGVRAVTCSESAPTNTPPRAQMFERAGTTQTLDVSPVDFTFFGFYGLEPAAGRFFAEDRGTDLVTTPADQTTPMQVSIVINETAVRALGFGSPENAMGQTIDAALGRETHFSVIGVVPDFPVSSVREAIKPTAYSVDRGRLGLVSIRLDGTAEALASVERAWQRFGEPRPFRGQFLSDYTRALHREVSRQAWLLTVFASIAGFIACLGLFGLTAFTTERRTKEIGVRKTMGARKRNVVRLLVWQLTQPVLWADLVAWPVAYFAMTRWLDGFAYRIALEPWMFAAAGASALVIAVATVSTQSFLVARAKPVVALRYE